MSSEHKSAPVKQRPRQAVEDMLRSSVPEQVGEALWSAVYYDPDWRWVQTQCLVSLRHPDVCVRRNAVSCLGLLAVFYRKLDLDLVLPALKKAREDPEIKASVEESLDDIRHSLVAQ